MKITDYKVDKYLAVAKAIGAMSKCSRRKFGAVILKDDDIVGTGYNGSARGTINCGDTIECAKDVAKEPSNLSYEYCSAVHAEENAIINSDRSDRVGATMFLAPAHGKGDRPCFRCQCRIINAQLKDIFYINKDDEVVHEPIALYVQLSNDWMMNTLLDAGAPEPDWNKFPNRPVPIPFEGGWICPACYKQNSMSDHILLSMPPQRTYVCSHCDYRKNVVISY